MPEMTVHMTCGQTGRAIEVRLTGGGDVKPRLIDEEHGADQQTTG